MSVYTDLLVLAGAVAGAAVFWALDRSFTGLVAYFTIVAATFVGGGIYLHMQKGKMPAPAQPVAADPVPEPKPDTPSEKRRKKRRRYGN